MTDDPGNPVDAAMRLAEARHRGGDLAGAEALYRAVLGSRPDHLGALHNLGSLLSSRGDPTGLALLEAGVSIAPESWQLWYALGVALQTAERAASAVSAYERALALHPDLVEAWENLAVALQDCGESTAAEGALREALGRKPDSVRGRFNLAKVLRGLGRSEDALQCVREALSLNPANPDLRLLEGSLCLALGRWVAGWRGYEWRHLSHEESAVRPPRMVPARRWRGEPLDGATVYLYGEQGVGDEIMFSRWAPAVAQREGVVWLECDPRLLALFGRSFPSIRCTPRRDHAADMVVGGPEEVGWCLSTPSLPAVMEVGSPDSVQGDRYLQVDADAVARWRHRLAAEAAGRPTVAISWRGGSDRRVSANRSIDLMKWRPLIEAFPLVRFVSVQYGNHDSEIDAFNGITGGRIDRVDGLDVTRDLDSLASFLCACDLLISVDNSTVHLAGAVGANTWLLLPANADFRWLLQGEKTPWYDSLTLIRGRAGTRWGDEGSDEVLEIARRRLMARGLQAEAELSVPSGHSSSSHRVSAVSELAPVERPDSRILLLNDTTYWYHWGCTCTSLALHEGLRGQGNQVRGWPISSSVRLRPPSSAKQLEGGALLDWLRQQQPALLEAIATADHVVVNGEGTLHGSSGPALSLLTLALLAKRELGRPVHLVNHSCFPPWQQEDPLALGIYEAAYCGADSVVVRERLSLENAVRLGATPRLGFDSLPLFLERHPVVCEKSDMVVISGSVAWSPASAAGLVELGYECERRGYTIVVLVGANGWMAPDDVGFASMALKHLGPRAQLVCAESEGQWLREIARAKLLVSGRFHHTIAAAFLGTPFLVGKTNTPKTLGALELMGFEPGQVLIGDAGPAADAVERALSGQMPALDASVAAGLRKLARNNIALSAP